MLKLLTITLGLAFICIGIALAVAGIFDRENLAWPWSENLFMAILLGLVTIVVGIRACFSDPMTVLFGFRHPSLTQHSSLITQHSSLPHSQLSSLNTQLFLSCN